MSTRYHLHRNPMKRTRADGQKLPCREIDREHHRRDYDDLYYRDTRVVRRGDHRRAQIRRRGG